MAFNIKKMVEGINLRLRYQFWLKLRHLRMAFDTSVVCMRITGDQVRQLVELFWGPSVSMHGKTKKQHTDFLHDLMKKKEVIAAVAFHDIPPSMEIEGHIELGDVTLTPLISGNSALKNAASIKEILESALPEKSDDDELDSDDFDALKQSLSNFRDIVLGAVIIPGVVDEVCREFAAKIATLELLRSE